MVPSLRRRTGRSFTLLTRPEELTVEILKPLNPRYIFLPHWSHRIPQAVFEEFECVIFHMTDLPFGRGGSPLQNLVARGIERTVISAIRCVQDFDAGPVYMKRPLSLQGSAEEIFIRASGVIADMIAEIAANEPAPCEQEGEVVSFKRRTPAQSRVDDEAGLDALYDHIRMLDADGYPRAFLETRGVRISFSRVQRKVGKLVADVEIVPIEKEGPK